MSFDMLLALSVYALASSITPGPNNMMLLTSGVNFGFRRTVPHILGISGGFLALLVAIGLGLGSLIKAYPGLELAMKFASAAYLIYLAWKIAFSHSLSHGEAAAQPLTFWQAAAFQWVNPKAWMIALAGMAAFVTADRPMLSMLIVAVVFTLINMPSVAVWAGFGVALRGFLSNPLRLRIFNIVMGILLVATIWLILA